MAYTRRNYLERIIDIQNIVLEHKQRGCTQKWVFDNVVKFRYRISEATYNNYLSINAKSELRTYENSQK